MPERVLDLDPRRRRPVGEDDGDRIPDRPLLGVEVIGRVARLLAYDATFTEAVHTRVGGEVVGVVTVRELAVQQGDDRDVLERVVSVGRVVERPGLVDDPERRLLGRDLDADDLVDAVADERVEA